jgi:hypothetical protein
MADLGGRAVVPTTSNPRSVDVALWERLGQDERQVRLELKLTDALNRLGILTLDTCINYQTVSPPRFIEHEPPGAISGRLIRARGSSPGTERRTSSTHLPRQVSYRSGRSGAHGDERICRSSPLRQAS